MRPPSDRSVFPWAIFWATALAGLAFFWIPAFIIVPFRRQTPAALALAMSLRQRAPWATLGAAFVCLVFALILWIAASKWRKIVLASVVVLVVFSTVMARLNYFEWMFHPVESPQFEASAQSKLGPDEMILAVRFGPDARAYPIREMGYHHVVNDVVGGIPIAVTY